jgi:hypothetical protein
VTDKTKFILIGSGLVLTTLGLSSGCAEMPTYPDGIRAWQLSRSLNSYDWMQTEFIFTRRRTFQQALDAPEYLVLQLREKHENLIDSIDWSNPLDQNGRPHYDWNVVRREFQAASEKLVHYSWLQEWKAAAKGRHIELHLVGGRSGEVLQFMEQWASGPWRAARLRGKPAYYIELVGEQSNYRQFLVFGKSEEHAILYYSTTQGDYPKRHWLDRIFVRSSSQFRDNKLSSDYAVIKQSGKWRRHIYWEG